MRLLDSRYRPLLVAVAVPLVATSAQWLLWDYIEPFAWFFYYPAVFFAALLTGQRGGIVATLVSALLVQYMFLPPRFSFRSDEVSDLASNALFVVLGLLFSFFHERMRRFYTSVARHESEERFAAFMTALPAHAWMKDERGCYAYANALIRQDVMSQREDYRGMSDADFFPQHIAQELRRNDELVLSSGKPQEFIERTTSQAGETKRWRSVKFPFRDAAGVRYVGGVAIEITQQEQTEEALREVKASLVLAQQAAEAGTWAWDLRTGKLDWSPELFRMFGLDPARSEASFDTWRSVLYPEDRQAAEDHIKNALARHLPLKDDYRILHPSQEVRWIHGRGKTWYDEQGTAQRMAGICLDITERKRTEAALRASDERYRLLADHSEDLVSLEDSGGKRLYISPSYGRVTGWTIEEVESTDWRVRMHPDDLPLIEQCKTRSWAGQSTTFEHRIRCRDGRWIWVEQHCRPISDADGQVRQLLLYAHEITMRKRAEVELRRINRTLRMISECSEVLVRATDESELLRAVCRLIVEAGGYRLAWVGFAESDEAKSVRPVAQAGFEAGYLDTVKITWADTERGRGPTGTAIRTGQRVIARNILTDPTFAPWRAAAIQRGYASSATFPLKRDERVLGALMVYSAEPETFDTDEVALLGNLADDLAYGISALRTRAQHERAQLALRESEEKLRTIFENAPVGIFRSTLQGRLLSVNSPGARMFGYDSPATFVTEVTDISAQLFGDPKQREIVLQDALASGKYVRHEVRYHRKNGSAFTANLYIRTVRGETSAPLLLEGFLEDITDRKEAEGQLRQLSAHLLQVRDLERRHLARELHDTTAQHLAALTLNLANLKDQLSNASDPVNSLCVDSMKLAHQAAQEIRTHSYLLHPPLLDVMGLVEAVKEYAQGLSARSSIAVEVHASGDFGRLPEDMELALFRIVQEGLANVLKHAGSERARICFTRRASSVILEIEDMGQGIPTEILVRLKDARGGHGVGLSGMRERLRLIGGRLELESGPTGTKVRAIVPLCESRIEPRLET